MIVTVYFWPLEQWLGLYKACVSLYVSFYFKVCLFLFHMICKIGSWTCSRRDTHSIAMHARPQFCNGKMGHSQSSNHPSGTHVRNLTKTNKSTAFIDNNNNNHHNNNNNNVNVNVTVTFCVPPSSHSAKIPTLCNAASWAKSLNQGLGRMVESRCAKKRPVQQWIYANNGYV